MKRINQISVILFAIISLMSCTSNNNSSYYIKPINDWMNSNLNDISSYEPVEFKIIKSKNDILKIRYQISDYLNVLQRELDLLPKLISELKNESNADTLMLRNIINITSQLSEIDFDLEIDFNKIDNLNTTLGSNLSAKLYQGSKNQEILELSAQLQGTLSRYNSEQRKLSEDFASFGTSKYSFYNDINSGCFIYHKYRSKNAFNAFILQETIFVLDNNKKSVIKAVNTLGDNI